MFFKEHYLYPSAIFVTDIPYKITTVLGTCVAICLWDERLKIGGINHYMLPLWNGEGLASPKYGNIATEKLLEKMLSMGCLKKDLIAKVFGGKNVQIELDSFKIGQKNIDYAYNILQELAIPIKGKSVGGVQGRKLMFHTGTGEVFMKYIPIST
jgi:chemotaxis protein CheD